MRILNLKEPKKHGREDFPVVLYTSQHFIPYQWHNEEEFIYMVSGQADYNINGTRVALRAGDCAFCGGRSLHSMMLDEQQKVRFDALLFDRSYLFGDKDVCNQFFDKGLHINPLFSPDVPAEAEIISVIKQISERMQKQPFGYEIEIKMLLIKVYSLILKNGLYTTGGNYTDTNIISKNLLAAVQYIHEHYPEKISVSQLAAMTGYSTTYFESFFKSYIGKTPVEYIIMYRLRCAQKLLKDSERSVLETAISCGFPNVSYFIRVFKKFYCVTPRQYQLRLTEQTLL